MKRLAALLVGALLLPLAGCGQSSQLTVTGRVVDDTITVAVPNLPMPKVNLDAGFSVTAKGVGRNLANQSPVTTFTGLGSYPRVATVAAQVGDQVKAGQVLVRFDSAALSADRTAALADVDVARSQVGVLSSALDDLSDKRSDLDKAEKKVKKAIKQLTSLQRQLTNKLATAKQAARSLPGKLAQVNAKLAQAQAAVAALPPQAPAEARAQLEAAVAQLTAAKKQLTAGLAAVKQGIPKLKAALKKIGAGLAKARKGLRTIASGRTKLTDARSQLGNLKSVAGILAKAAKVGVSFADNARANAVVTAPTDGTLVQIVDVGAVLAPGATAATIRPPTRRIATWLAPDQLAQVCRGDRATILGDWMTTPVAAEISLLGVNADYPPTSFPTDAVHLTRAVPVELTADDEGLPVGVPFDVRLTPCHPAGVQR